MFIAALFAITKIWKKPTCPPVDEWTKQLWDICPVEYYSAIKKKKNLPFVTVWMDLENFMGREISQSEEDNTIWSHSHVESSEQADLAHKVETQTQTAGRQLWGGEGEQGLSKKEKRLMDMDNSALIVGGEGVKWG